MNELKLIEKLQLLVIRTMLKLNQISHKNQLNSNNDTKKFGTLEHITKYLGAKKISLQLYKKDEDKKAYIFAITQLLREYGIDIELIEFEPIFSNEDMVSLLEKNPDASINLRYMLRTYYTGCNVQTDYNISEYCQILDKIGYLCKVTKTNFKNPEEQIIFIITQLAGYISCDQEYSRLSEEQLKEGSSLKGALLGRKTVCIGYATALERCLTTLGVECNIITGIASREEPENIQITDLTGNHAWNQVKIGENWYNVDLTFFSGSGDLKNILVADKTFEGHYLTDESKALPCNDTYSRSQEVYDRIKNIKNVLVGYDSGKRDTILQYNVSNNQAKEKSEEERQVNKNNELYHSEEK